MKKVLLITLIVTLLFPIPSFAENKEVKAAFIRDGNLWTLINNKEKQITSTGKVIGQPKWSKDGQWLLYQNEAPSMHMDKELQHEIWAYHLQTGEKKKIFYDGYSPTWSPKKNVIAYNQEGILDISDFTRFYNIATGVNSFTWLPDGSGFMLSSAGTLRPDGWTSAILFTKKVGDDYKDIVLFGGVDRLFKLPREIGTTKDNKIIAVYAEDFNYSPSKKWISFIVSPTASWSMDSNMLCVISSDGKNFSVLDELIFDIGKPKWAPSTDTIAYIAGGGRIVFGFKNKDLKIEVMPASTKYTPDNYIDLDFDWISDTAIVSSRSKAAEWTNDFTKHPLPSLYFIDLRSNRQQKITDPPKGYGDYNPIYVKSMDQLVWYRKTSIIDNTRNLWKANTNGTDVKLWLKNVDTIEFYEGSL
ncbi:TolB family protein [Bacillus sp. USDA818B3_A]|uniref:TolB family protein n=1 Tax=Bacillus sp. USDA818B3_A TaxID=2698834 RepID=UPI001368F457|nr:PD40 domain-containing protein [Bacillus sp. USDA818B3_A]